MAEQLFIDQSTLAMYENGTREIPIDILVKLSKIYGISVDYLLCVSDFAVLEMRSSAPRQRNLSTALAQRRCLRSKGTFAE